MTPQQPRSTVGCANAIAFSKSSLICSEQAEFPQIDRHYHVFHEEQHGINWRWDLAKPKNLNNGACFLRLPDPGVL